jgi:hypothetical protein
VSISTTREIPSALGLPAQNDVAAAGGMAACIGTEVAAGTVLGEAASDDPSVRTVRAFGVTYDLSPVVSANGVFCSSTVATTARTASCAGAVGAGDAEPAGLESLCERMPPNTATHITMTSAHTIAASRIAKSPNPENFRRHRGRKVRFG